jgi:hypothetical protein
MSHRFNLFYFIYVQSVENISFSRFKIYEFLKKCSTLFIEAALPQIFSSTPLLYFIFNN